MIFRGLLLTATAVLLLIGSETGAWALVSQELAFLEIGDSQELEDGSNPQRMRL
jgi:hypothetical protein